MSVFTELSPAQLDALYDSIGVYSSMLSSAARKKNTVGIYDAMKQLDVCRAKLQSHHAAVELRKAQGGTNGQG